MKFKRLLLLITVLSLFGAATVIASDGFEWYKGKQVKVIVNGETLDASGLLVSMDGTSKTLLPMRDIADTLQAIVKWDSGSQTVSIFKPNIHISLSTQNKDGSYGTFGTVHHKVKSEFFIFAQMDSLTTDIHAIKFEIVDPSNNVVYESEHTLKNPVSEMLWFRTPSISMTFKELGKYMVKVYMKQDSKGSYFLMSEKGFNSI